MRKLICLVLCLLSQSGLAAEATKLPVPEIETLPNGLSIAWFANDSLPVIDLALLVKSGHRDDPIGKSGTAELVSEVLDRGAGGMSAQEISHAVEMIGASRYASADEDTFSIGMHGLALDGPTLLDLLAKISLKPEFAESEVKREHARLLDRWSHVPDYADTLSSLVFSRVLTTGTSYGRGSFVSVKEFEKVTRDDVVAFYRSHFTPKNSLLMIVGRVNKPEFRKKVIEAFGQWQGEAPKREWRKFNDKRLFGTGRRVKNQIYIVDRPNVNQAQVRIGFRAPLINAPEHYPLVVGNALLGEYFNSRLNSLIRDKLALTYGIHSSFAYSKDLAYFSVSSATKSESAGQLIRKTLDVLKDLKRGPIGQDEITMAKDYLAGGFPLATSTLGAVATRWVNGYLFGLGPDYLNGFIPKVSNVTRDEVSSAIAKDFPLDDLVIVVVGDSKEIEKSLRSAKLGAIRRVSIADLL